MAADAKIEAALCVRGRTCDRRTQSDLTFDSFFIETGAISKVDVQNGQTDRRTEPKEGRPLSSEGGIIRLLLDGDDPGWVAGEGDGTAERGARALPASHDVLQGTRAALSKESLQVRALSRSRVSVSLSFLSVYSVARDLVICTLMIGAAITAIYLLTGSGPPDRR
eukprot:scaffold1366_cov233-Pinguiococcus_pyrenoidosus.AAC.2